MSGRRRRKRRSTGRSILTGKNRLESGVWSLKQAVASSFRLKTKDLRLKTQLGFSLLELMIAMFIMIILLSVAVPTYQRSVQQARETVLKENLWQIRRSIDQFMADKGKLPAIGRRACRGQIPSRKADRSGARTCRVERDPGRGPDVARRRTGSHRRQESLRGAGQQRRRIQRILVVL